MIRILQQSGRWLLIALLIFAPWAFGGTRPWAIAWTIIGMYACAALNLIPAFAAWVVHRRWSVPGLPGSAAVLVGVILIIGWFQVWNAKSFYDPYLLTFMPLKIRLSLLPGTVDTAASAAAMTRLTGLLLMMLTGAIVTHDPRWRRRLFVTMALTGISIALFGMAQKLAHAPLLFWNPADFTETVFAMYRYHANAGAYLNLVWPICAALAFDAFARRGANIQRALWLPGTFLILAGLAANISKGAQLVTGLLLVGGGLGAAALWLRIERPLRWKWMLAIILLIGASVATLAALGSQSKSWDRWTVLFRSDPLNEGRLWMARACLDIIRDRPWCGYGPGTFPLVFPFYSHPYSDSLVGIWHFAHSDHLQMLVEWGILGCIPWALLIGTGMIHLMTRICRHRDGRRESHDQRDLEPNVRVPEVAVFLSLAGVLIHAVFDFPLQIASIQLYFAVLLGIAWRRRTGKARRRSNGDK